MDALVKIWPVAALAKVPRAVERNGLLDDDFAGVAGVSSSAGAAGAAAAGASSSGAGGSSSTTRA